MPRRPATSKDKGRNYVLTLYVSGASERSRHAMQNLNSICEEYLQGRYELEVVDVYNLSNPARDADIVATPTLVRHYPLPQRRILGDLSKRGSVLMLLDLKKRA